MQQAINFIVGGLLVGGAYALIAIGFSLIYSVTGTINLAQGAFVGLGALLMYTLYVTYSLPLPLALLISISVIGAVAALTDRLVMRPALARLSRMHILLLTSGLLIFFQGAALIIWGSQPYALPSFSGERPLQFGSVLLPTQGIWILIALAIVVAGLWWLFYRTTFGMALRACAENPNAASLMGVPVSRMIFFAFTASGVIGALGGIMVAPIASLAFNSAARFTTEGFVAAVLGGMGNFIGGVVGGLTLGVLEQNAAGWVSSLFSTTLALVVLLLMLLTRPQGILASRRGLRADAHELPPRGGSTLPAGFHRHLLWIALPVGVILFAVPLFVSSESLLNSLVLTGIFFLTMIGLDLLMGFAGQVSLGQAGFMAIGGYTSAILTLRMGLPPILGVLVGLVLTLGVAAILSYVSVKLRGAYLAMATLAFGLLIESLAVGLMDITGGPSGFVGIPSFSLGAIHFDGIVPNYYLVWTVVAIAFFLAANIARSARGRALWAIQTDQTAAQALGVDVVAYKTMTFLLSAGMASLAGSLYGFYFHFLSPDMVGIQTSLDLPIMLVLGGEGTLIGPLIGVGLLTFLPTLFQPLALFKPLVEGILLVVILLWFPGGIFGGLVDLYARLFLRFVPRGPGKLAARPALERRE